MPFYNKQFSDSQFGVQGDLQDRNWDLDGNFEQRLIRNGLTFKPKESNVLLTLGYGNIQSGIFLFRFNLECTQEMISLKKDTSIGVLITPLKN